jgi:hypothetical protein
MSTTKVMPVKIGDVRITSWTDYRVVLVTAVNESEWRCNFVSQNNKNMHIACDYPIGILQENTIVVITNKKLLKLLRYA